MISGAVVLLFAQKKLSGTQFQKGERLGYFVDLQSGVISVPAVRTQKLKERIVSLLDTGATARKTAGVMDTVISMGLALEPVARLWTRSLYTFSNLKMTKVLHGGSLQGTFNV